MTLSESTLVQVRTKHADAKIVLAYGVFDLFHAGHVDYLEWCSQQGDILVVALNNDESVKMLKGKYRPIHKQADRSRLVSSLKTVDYSVVIESTTKNFDAPLKVARKLQPDLIALGSDSPKEFIDRLLKEFPKNNVFVDSQSRVNSSSSIVSRIRTLRNESRAQ